MTAVSWKVIQHGWKVAASDGEHVGVVFLVVGDENSNRNSLGVCHGSTSLSM